MTIIPNLSVILACDDTGGIGKNNALFCHVPEDLKWFKNNTAHKKIIMGSNTFRSIQQYTKNKLLPHREHIVLSKNIEQTVPGVKYFQDIEPLLALIKAHPTEEFMIIGGAQIYNQFLPMANRLYLTRIAGEYGCDAFVDLNLYNNGLADTQYVQVDKTEASDYDYHFRTYTLNPWEAAPITQASPAVKAKI